MGASRRGHGFRERRAGEERYLPTKQLASSGCRGVGVW